MMAGSMVRRRKTRLGSIVFFSAISFITAVGIPLYVYHKGLSISEIGLFTFFVLVTSFSITIGYHRLFSHRAFIAHPILKFLVLFFGAAAFEQSALKWASLHRRHHQYVDTELDPYNIKFGFWYAHIGWVLMWKQSINYNNVKDLWENPMIRHQHKHYRFWSLIAGLVLPMLLGAATGHIVGALFFAVCARLVLVLNSNFFINSFAHTFGRKPYDVSSSAKDNWLGAFLTNGEGYHNFHHRFPNDYRNGVRWRDWDPTKWAIWVLEKFKMVWNLKRTPSSQILGALRETALEKAL